MSNVKSVVRKHLLAGIAAQAGVEELQRKLGEAREGMYTCAVRAFNAADSKETFVEVCDKLMSDFRSNARDIATRHGCAQAKDNAGKAKFDKDGNPVFVVPNSLSSAKSYLASASDLGIQTERSDGEPESFSAIRDAVRHAKAEAKKAREAEALTPDDKVRNECLDIMEGMVEALAELEGKSLTAVRKLLQVTATEIAKAA